MILQARMEGTGLWTTLENIPKATDPQELLRGQLAARLNTMAQQGPVEVRVRDSAGDLRLSVRMDHREWFDTDGDLQPGLGKITTEAPGVPTGITAEEVRAAQRAIVKRITGQAAQNAIRQALGEFPGLSESAAKAKNSAEALHKTLKGVKRKGKKKRRKREKKERKAARKAAKSLRAPMPLVHAEDALDYAKGKIINPRRYPTPSIIVDRHSIDFSDHPPEVLRGDRDSNGRTSYTVRIQGEDGRATTATGVVPNCDGSAKIQFPDGSVAELAPGTLKP